MKKDRKLMWVSGEFYDFVKNLSLDEKRKLRLKKKPSSVDITHKLFYELERKETKPLRFTFLK